MAEVWASEPLPRVVAVLDAGLCIILVDGGRRVQLQEGSPLPWVPADHPVTALFGPWSTEVMQPSCDRALVP